MVSQSVETMDDMMDKIEKLKGMGNDYKTKK
jgi:hypothetical protein